MNDSNIPYLFWQTLCESADYPMACVDLNNKFVWVNGAFQKLVGYSVSELVGKSWISITEQGDVGGDLASVQAVIDGKITSYMMSKNYIHKRGFKVPIELIVARFPKSQLDDLLYFQVEASPAQVNKAELGEIESRLLRTVEELRAKVEGNSRNIQIINKNEGSQMGDRWEDGDKVGRDKTTNSDSTLKILAGALIFIVIIVAWLFYYVVIGNTGGTPQPPPSLPTTITETIGIETNVTADNN